MITQFRKTAMNLALLVGSMAATGQWEEVNVPTTASLRGLSVVSATTVWASGTDGTVLHTADGGKLWSVIAVPGAEKLDFRGIHAFDDNAAVIISSGPAEKGQARIYRTIDGGASWKQVFEETRKGVFFDAIAFWDSKHGIVLSDPVDGRFALFTTNDSGVSWKQIPATALPPALPNEGAFAASNSCLTVQGDGNVWFATGGATIARVFHSSDRGHSWSVAETPLHPTNAFSGIFSLAFRDAQNGVAVGGDYAHPEESGLPNVLLTNDGGGTWLPGTPTSPAGMYFSSVAFGAAMRKGGPKSLWVAGPGGLYSTSPESRLWNKESGQNLNAVHGTWAIGPKGTVIHRRNNDPT
jgi:photosystem II stability/assembly factor-like uncharacterized protein